MLKRIMIKLIPTKLKIRLFTASLFLIVLPFAIIQNYQFREVESLVMNQINELNSNQLYQLAEGFESLRSKASLTMFQYEKDFVLMDIWQHPELYNERERNGLMEEKFRLTRNQLPASSYVHYVIADTHENIYSSYTPAKPLQPKTFWKQPEEVGAGPSQQSLGWRLVNSNSLNLDGATSPSLLSNFSVVQDQNRMPMAYIHIFIDYEAWLRANSQDFSTGQSYFIVNQIGETVTQTKRGSLLTEETVRSVLNGERQYPYMEEPGMTSTINSVFIPSMQWYFVGKFPISLFFGDLIGLKRKFLLTSLIITSVFIGITLLISGSITRPLQRVQKKMLEMGKNNLKIQIQEQPYKGEILTFVQSFNRMATDIKDLVEQLKIEERQKEALHFQMLLNQIDPHFLLNTLNTIKWVSLDQNNQTVYEISVALGRLLEASLSSEQDLIHLCKELELIRSYEYIQKYRFKDMFETRYTIESELEYALVPKLCLQPLVENAIYHGFANMQQGGIVDIRIYRERQGMVLEVQDNGQGIQSAQQTTARRQRKGIGLENIKQRIQLLYHAEASVEVVSDSCGTLVRITIPLLIAAPFLEGEDRFVDGSVS
ncbi:sensor histidine kinase [Paenibacillus thalictri]|uniref:histidine kinase n=1 Tax=Paenibacillus thalictri TaxID=2527873 RepID=A0A4V2J2Z6_9BACL|nr:histidine kinase [Paenibacillus thalictri]TBL68348.1 HAMP domain-containing protein [Paenibacillus thalictri]